MGTQFSSRLTPSNSQRIIDRLREARSTISAATETKNGGRTRKLQALTPRQETKFGKAAIASVVAEGEAHNLLNDLERSRNFPGTLRWLYHLRNDAQFSGFQETISLYGLDKSLNPIAEISHQLSRLTAEDDAPDPFRVYSAIAARAVLTAVYSQPVARDIVDPVTQLRKKFEALDTKSIMIKYVSAFINELLSSILHRSDPDQTSRIVKEALKTSSRSAGQVARRVEARVVRKAKLSDVEHVHRSVVAELRELVQSVESDT